MFDQYEYLNSIFPDFNELKSIARVSGIAGMEEAISNARTFKPPMLLVEDDGNGFLSFDRGNFDHGFHSFSIVAKVKLNDSSSRLEALNTSMATARKIFKRMLADSQNFGDPCYGFDRSRIDYQRIGPLLHNTYGYMFSYVVSDENFTLDG